MSSVSGGLPLVPKNWLMPKSDTDARLTSQSVYECDNIDGFPMPIDGSY